MIRKRPKIGKLPNPEFLDEWDVLIVCKLDCGFRNHLDFVTFYHEYCERYGKKIVSVGEEGLDMPRMGRMFAGILVRFAELELQTIGECRGQGRTSCAVLAAGGTPPRCATQRRARRRAALG